jgi:thiol:disulfide interchange protein
MTCAFGGRWLLSAPEKWASSRMLRRSATKLVSIASLFLMLGSAAVAAGPQDGPRLADITVSTPQGTTDALSAFKGKPTVVNLWATWCLPCQREIPCCSARRPNSPT